MKFKKHKLFLFIAAAQMAVNTHANAPLNTSSHCYNITHAAATTTTKTEHITCLNTLLEEIVTTGTRTEKSARLHPGSLSIINQEAIQRSMVNGAAELLRDIPGVQITDAGQAGSKRLRIRGEESRRIAILIDNQEVTDHREVGVPLTLDAEQIERIEVVRGPNSVLYGSKAIGGVVNFITKKGGYHPIQGTASMGYDDASGGRNEFVSLFGSTEAFDYRLSTTKAEHDNRQSPEGDIENTRSNSESVSFYAGLKLTEQQHLKLNYVNYKSDSEVFVEEDVRTSYPLIDFAINAPKRDREKLGVFYRYDDISERLSKIEFNAFWQISNRQFNTFPSLLMGPMQSDGSIYTSSELITSGALLQADWQLPADNTLITGFQYLNDELEQDRTKITETTLFIDPTAIVQPTKTETSFDEAEMETLALFAQNEWAARDDLTITLGARQYFVDAKLTNSAQTNLPTNSVDDKQLVVALSALYSGQEHFIWRVNASQGYVYPSLLQMATGAYGGSSFISPNGDLSPETSDNFEVGMRYFENGLTLDLSTFYSKSKDYIDHIPCEPDDNCINLSRSNKIYKNIGTSTNMGIELTAEYDFSNTPIEPYLSLAWMRKENQYDDFSTKKTGWPEWSGKIGAHYQLTFDNNLFWLDSYVQAESSADTETPTKTNRKLEENSGWATINLSSGVNFGANRQYKMALHILNIANKTYSTATENLLAPKRHIRLKLTAGF